MERDSAAAWEVEMSETFAVAVWCTTMCVGPVDRTSIACPGARAPQSARVKTFGVAAALASRAVVVSIVPPSSTPPARSTAPRSMVLRSSLSAAIDRVLSVRGIQDADTEDTIDYQE
ncbi:hypothetical protein GCM10007147_41910 [Nocardiopsis kunsanensis]|uniref:Uncharacterized protein n=1 Tax=Nocardiopsis kunsanensis TaxID=141693 RepID=A0A918XL07_9ACTN|nr:hypothetical protein GCM10007147_41910 [Nocardiopsis kunsanensis]